MNRIFKTFFSEVGTAVKILFEGLEKELVNEIKGIIVNIDFNIEKEDLIINDRVDDLINYVNENKSKGLSLFEQKEIINRDKHYESIKDMNELNKNIINEIYKMTYYEDSDGMIHKGELDYKYYETILNEMKGILMENFTLKMKEATISINEIFKSKENRRLDNLFDEELFKILINKYNVESEKIINKDNIVKKVKRLHKIDVKEEYNLKKREIKNQKK